MFEKLINNTIKVLYCKSMVTENTVLWKSVSLLQKVHQQKICD
jgi:hypothetical protein